ncbi:C40 family peptidase [bacterium]|nr:C40 family peptidase [candidate division CSSED10-310 bacterium]
MNYTIQAGAFAIQDNAIRFTERLREHGMDAYYFIAEDTLFKVRFGDFTTRSDAEQTARNLVNEGTIDAFYIVQPELRSSADIPEKTKDLRRHLVHTAMRFIGCPYRYGGVSENGFDCSGLTMTIYRLNGLNLPRVSLDQYRLGRRVSLAQLQPGDLVFFRTTGNDAITHVGIYTGKGNFIHAPGKGKFVRTASLSEPYFEERYAGARNCLD